MARVSGLIPLFGGRQVQNVLDQFVERQERNTHQSLQYLGEEFVNKARLSGNYTDRTGNLRSSIGYIILHNGKVVDENFKLSEKGTDRNSGLKMASKVANEVATQYPQGWVLIGVAGMEYAAYVEAKNYDVISGSAPGSNYIKSILSEIKY